jgi:hypothetical protein
VRAHALRRWRAKLVIFRVDHLTGESRVTSGGLAVAPAGFSAAGAIVGAPASLLTNETGETQDLRCINVVENASEEGERVFYALLLPHVLDSDARKSRMRAACNYALLFAWPIAAVDERPLLAQSVRRATERFPPDLPLTSAAFEPLSFGYLPCHAAQSQRRSVRGHLPSLLIHADYFAAIPPAPMRPQAAGHKHRTACVLRRR